MSAVEPVQAVLLLAGACFFAVGTLGVLRLPDTYTRLHALTKADNLGLGLIVFGLILGADSLPLILRLLVIWGLVLIASATAGYLVARAARRNGVRVWRRPRKGTP
jgi:multicomponent Na+:H+ antiporter subunit G